MVKNYKCPGCGATMEYDPQDGKMHCAFCKSSYEPDQIGRRASSDDPPKIVAAERETARKQARIAVNVAVCNSCGAELAVNAVEASSFCPYCGNASVVMDRVEEQLAPDYIIPFKVSKEEAEGIIRKRLKSGFFVPKEVRDFELEKLNGVYIPFWLYDIYYGDDQIWSYRSFFSKHSIEERLIHDCVYHQLSVDASKRFEDASSQRLEPYDMRDLKEFDAAYLSGFYSDRFDVGTQEADMTALGRAEKLFNEEVKDRISGSFANLQGTNPEKEVMSRNYALLPVWFLTFQYKQRPYTLLVNGQTRKMVGTVPFDKKKALTIFLSLAAFLGLFFGIVGGGSLGALNSASPYESGEGNLAFHICWVLGSLLIWALTIRKLFAIRRSFKLSRSRSNYKLAKERQGIEG